MEIVRDDGNLEEKRLMDLGREATRPHLLFWYNYFCCSSFWFCSVLILKLYEKCYSNKVFFLSFSQRSDISHLLQGYQAWLTFQCLLFPWRLSSNSLRYRARKATCYLFDEPTLLRQGFRFSWLTVFDISTIQKVIEQHKRVQTDRRIEQRYGNKEREKKT